MIRVEKLEKRFGPIHAVKGISFEVNKGEILGFLGPNGAGKSTSMKMITGFLEPTGGTAFVNGKDVLKDPIGVKSCLGYLPENSPLYNDMNVFDFLEFVAEVRGFSGKDKTNRVFSIIERCNLKPVAYQSIDTLSKGYRQRVGLAQALIHDPEYLILDEPTDGLDPNQKHEVRKLISEMGREKCIILSTHILEEMENLCTRAVIISSGTIVADDTPDNMRKQSSLHNAVRLTLGGVKPNEAASVLEKVEDVMKVEIKNSQLTIFPKNKKSIAHNIAHVLHEKKWEEQEFIVEKGRLDEVFRNVTEGGKS